MSIKIMTRVWDQAMAVRSDRLIVLLALADWANDEGECWPKMETIASKTRTTERGASGIIRWLEDKGYVTAKKGNGRGNKSRYVVHPSPVNPEQRSSFISEERMNEDALKDEADDIERMNEDALKDEADAEGTIRNARVNRQEPSVRTVNEPPVALPEKKVLTHAEIINTESPFAKSIRELCGKRTLMLSGNDQKDLIYVLEALHREGATIDQVKEFGRKMAGHWITVNTRTKKTQPPKIIQILEYWYPILESDESEVSSPSRRLTDAELDAIAAKY